MINMDMVSLEKIKKNIACTFYVSTFLIRLNNMKENMNCGRINEWIHGGKVPVCVTKTVTVSDVIQGSKADRVILPSLSISNTLMASSGLRERNSLAGSVWRRPCGPGERMWSGFMKGTALTNDMVLFYPPQKRASKWSKDAEILLSLQSAGLSFSTSVSSLSDLCVTGLCVKTERRVAHLEYLYPRRPGGGWL